MQRSSAHGTWSSRTGFILAAVGSAVGLGNIWRFPYEAGQGGGAAFILIYLAFVFGIGVPVMIAELGLGRRGRGSPPTSWARVATDEGRSRWWQSAGWLSVAAAALLLSFYSVIGGWTLSYLAEMLSGQLSGLAVEQSNAVFDGLLADEGRVVLWHALFMGVTIFIVARGIRRGLELTVTLLMPLLFALLIGLAIYALMAGDAAAALRFLFEPDFSELTPGVVLGVLGQAFFSLSLGVGSMVTYGAYLSERVSIPRSALTIAGADALVAMTAGLMIFPLVFAFGLEADAGPGLIFVTLPIAFGQMAGGQIVGTLFFLLMAVAAVTSSIAMLEVLVSWLEERRGVKRSIAAIAAGAAMFVVGLTTVFSFSRWSDIQFFIGTFFDNIDFLVNSVMMPLGGLLVVLVTGWIVSRKSMRNELHTINDRQFGVWYAMARVVCPVALLAIFLSVVGVI